MVWEGKPKYKSVDAALDDLEAALEKIIEEIGQTVHEFSTNARMSAPQIRIFVTPFVDGDFHPRAGHRRNGLGRQTQIQNSGRRP